jgi:hypothetical protein
MITQREEREQELRTMLRTTQFIGFTLEEIEEGVQVILAIEFELN